MTTFFPTLWSTVIGPILIMPLVFFWMWRNRAWLFPERMGYSEDEVRR